MEKLFKHIAIIYRSWQNETRSCILPYFDWHCVRDLKLGNTAHGIGVKIITNKLNILFHKDKNTH